MKKKKRKKKHRYDKWNFIGDLLEFILEVVFDIT